MEDNNKKTTKINIISNNQSGGITAQNVHIGKQPRNFDDEAKTDLTKLLNDKSQEIEVISIMGDNESFGLAVEVVDYLKSSGYLCVEGPNPFFFPEAIYGTKLHPDGDNMKIVIGSQK